MKKIGVLGAGFNPPTLGHRNVILQALSYFDEIILVPSLKHPFNKPLAPQLHRFFMLHLFIQSLPQAIRHRVIFMNIEGMLLTERDRKYVYTYDVLCKISRYFEILNQAVEIRFIIGPDNAQKKVWEKFYKFELINQKWPPLVVQENVKIHSEHARKLIKQYKQQPAKLTQALFAVLEPPIAHYVVHHQLYV